MVTPDGNLPTGMRQLNGVYTQRFNEAHRGCGHLSQGRYKAIIVQKEAYLKQVFLGSQAFVEHVRHQLPQGQDLSKIPRAQRRSPAKPLPEYASLHPDRDEAIAAAYVSGGFTLKEIGDYFGLHYAQVSRIVRRVKNAKCKMDSCPKVETEMRPRTG